MAFAKVQRLTAQSSDAFTTSVLANQKGQVNHGLPFFSKEEVTLITISLCMIVRNEEEVLGRCLESVQRAMDEIIIVDTGSTDRTKEIAKTFTDKVYDFAWINDFSAARNEAFSKATMDYQMWLDADDVMDSEELEKLIALKKTLKPDVDMVTMRYHTHFDSMGRPTLTSTRERLMRRAGGYRWQDPVHECIALAGNVYYSDIVVWHKKPPQETVSTRNLEIYQALEASGKDMTPRQQYYYARELKDHGLFARSAVYFERFLDGAQGWVEDNIAACFNLGLCYGALKQWEKQQQILVRSFLYDAPRAEICCQLGYSYKRVGDWKKALKWFDLAASLEQTEVVGFVLQDYWGYIPNVEACVCAFHMGDREKAKVYNERAAAYKPEDPSIAHNRAALSGEA